MICNKHNIIIKSKHSQCRKCYLGNERYNKEKSRLNQRKNLRKIRNSYRQFTCEMGYGDCEKRGYCNGDC